MSKQPIYSMTGFASVRGTAADGLEFTLTAKSVNHRFLDLSLRLPGSCESMERALRSMVKSGVRRGHLDVSLNVQRGVTGGMEINDEMVGAYVVAFRRAAEAHGLIGEPDLNAILRIPGILRAAQTESKAEVQGLLEAAVLEQMATLLSALNAVRGAEGAMLAEEMRAGMGRLAQMVGQLRGAREGMREQHFESLKARIAELTAQTAVDEGRLLTEAAVMAERGDVEEEMVRLQAHVETFVGMLEDGGEVGKRLDFLLQELNREANTVLSKTGGGSGVDGLEITSLGLAMKMEIERAREQVQNLE